MAGFDPATDPSDTKDLQQSIAQNRENGADNVMALAKQIAGMTADQRARLAAAMAQITND